MTLGFVTTIAPSVGGDDTITTGAEADIVIGGAAPTRSTPAAGDDLVLGDNGSLDYVSPTATRPTSTSSRRWTRTIGGADTITTGDGDDIVIAGADDDVVDAGDGPQPRRR